jgi:hypothetical protein
MGPDRDKLYSWATPDVAQPLDELERMQVDAAFAILERLLRGPVVLMVGRPEFGGYSFLEPRHSHVDFERVYALLSAICEYMEDQPA